VKAVVTATALSSTLASLLCGLTANLPVGMSPGMGLNAYLVFSQVSKRTKLACRTDAAPACSVR
jgi:xanthine/uracil/vitamin C permease (AzgA family)